MFTIKNIQSTLNLQNILNYQQIIHDFLILHSYNLEQEFKAFKYEEHIRDIQSFFEK